MRQLLLSFALLAILPVSAQWELFPVGQRSYFMDQTQADTQVDLVLMDSVRMDPVEGMYLYDRTNIHDQLFGACAGPVIQQLALMYQGMGYPARMDSLLERNDTVFYFSNSSTLPFFFLPKASVGQGWTVSSNYSGNAYNDILITCTGATEESFQGITDSVKTFSLAAVGTVAPINDFQIRLSKQHGLIEYVPFEQFLIHPSWTAIRSFLLIGMETGGTAYNYRQPDFADYFHLTVGDVLLWRTDNFPWDISEPHTTAFRRDSIVAVLATPDSVTYICDGLRVLADSSLAPFQGLQVKYRKADVKGLLGAAPNDWAIGIGTSGGFPAWLEYNGIWHSGPLELTVGQNGTDTITSFGFSTYGAHLDSACLVQENVDWNYEWRINTRAGLIRHCENFGMGTNCTELIGSWINGELVGDITVRVEDLAHLGPDLAIRTNPATDRIFLKGQNTGAAYTILDDLGRIMKRGTLADGGIPVQLLPKGMYVLRLFRSNSVQSARFVKE